MDCSGALICGQLLHSAALVQDCSGARSADLGRPDPLLLCALDLLAWFSMHACSRVYCCFLCGLLCACFVGYSLHFFVDLRVACILLHMRVLRRSTDERRSALGALRCSDTLMLGLQCLELPGAWQPPMMVSLVVKCLAAHRHNSTSESRWLLHLAKTHCLFAFDTPALGYSAQHGTYGF